MISFLGIMTFVASLIFIFVGASDLDNYKEAAAKVIMLGIVLFISSCFILTANYVRITKMPEYTKIYISEDRDIMYRCKPVPFSDKDQCTAIKERIKMKYNVIPEPVWTDIEVGE